MEGVIPLHFYSQEKTRNMRKVIHGHLGKIVYQKEHFKDVPPTTEERRRKLLEKMKPWEFDPKLPIYVGGKAGGTPTPVETFHLTDEASNPLLTEGGDFIDFDYV